MHVGGRADSTREVIAYYRETEPDYLELWTGPQDLAAHLGVRWSEQEHALSLLRLNEVVAGLASVVKEDHILDAGCGFGGSSTWLQKRYGSRVTAINLVLQQMLTGRLIGKLTSPFVCADFHRLPFSDQAFDLIWSIEATVHSYDRSSLFNEFARLLRSSGRLVTAEFMLRRDCIDRRSAELLTAFRQGWAIESLLDQHELEDLLGKCGLSVAVQRDITRDIAESVARLNELAKIALQSTDAPDSKWSIVRRRNIYAAVALWTLVQRGVISYQITRIRRR